MGRAADALRRLVTTLAERPAIGVGIVAVVTISCLPALPRLAVDNSLEAWLARDSAEYREYEAFRQEFGSEEFVLVVYELGRRMDDALLERLVDLRFELEEVAGVGGVYDLSTIYSRFFALLGRERFEEDLTSPFYRDFLVSEDLRYAATWVLLDLGSAADRTAVVEGVEAAARRAGFGERFWLAGSPVLNVAARRFYPLVCAVSALILLLVFRRLAGVLIPMISVGCGLVWTLGLLAASGRRLDMVTVALPPVVWVVGLATAIHLLARCQAKLRRGEAARDAVPATLAELGLPCSLSALTTARGFAALQVPSMPPVREVGLFASLGVVSCLTSNFLLFPALGRWWGRDTGRWSERSRLAARLEALGEWVLAHPRRILTVVAGLSLAALAGVLLLRADSNVVEFFDDETEIARVYREVLPGLTGPYSMEVLLDVGEDQVDLPTLRRVDRLAAEIEEQPGVARVLSVVDFVKKAAVPIDARDAPYELPADEAALDEAWLRVERELGEEVAPLRAAGGRLRLSVIARPMGSSEHRLLVERIEELTRRSELEPLAPRLTGVVTLLVELQDELLASQVQSFSLAFAVIAPLMAAFFGSLRLALLSLPPNLVPILLTLGFMGAAGIRLNPATVMIAAIAFGIVVDDSIHFLTHYREERRRGVEVRAAILDTLGAVGRPLWITSLVVASGYSVLCFSSFVPLFDFGILSAATMLAALAGNLVLLPAVLAVVER